MLLTLVHTHVQLTNKYRHRARPSDADRENAEAKKLLDGLTSSAVPTPEVGLEKVRWLEHQRGKSGADVSVTLSELSSADADGACGAYARGRLALEGKPPKLEEA